MKSIEEQIQELKARRGAIILAHNYQIDEVQAAGPLCLPAQCLGHRIVVELGDLSVVTLMQAYASSTQQIDGGNDLHGLRDGSQSPILQRG